MNFTFKMYKIQQEKRLDSSPHTPQNKRPFPLSSIMIIMMMVMFDVLLENVVMNFSSISFPKTFMIYSLLNLMGGPALFNGINVLGKSGVELLLKS